LFAEIGDALRIISHPDEIPGWVRSRIDGRQLEPLILASSLNPDVATAASDALRERPDDLALAHALARAVNEGAKLDYNAIRSLCERLIAHIATGNWEGWQDWASLTTLPMPADLRNSAESAARRHSPAHALVTRAALDLRFHEHAALTLNPASLLEVLTLPDLPRRPPAKPDAQPRYMLATVDRTLTATQLSVAEALLGHAPEAVELITKWALCAPRGLQESLLGLLAERGFDDEGTRQPTRSAVGNSRL
jgi:hypothetical protein